MIKKKQLLFGLLAIALACPLTAMAQPLATPSHSYTTMVNFGLPSRRRAINIGANRCRR